MNAVTEQQIAQRLASCRECPNYRAGVREGWCLRLPHGSELVSAEYFSDELRKHRQSRECLKKWKE